MGKNKDEEVNKSLALLAKGSLVVFIGVFISKILTYVYKFIIARYFGPESYGLFSLALVIVTLFSTAASLGLSDGLLRYFSLYGRDWKKLKVLVRISVNITLISGLIATAIMFFLSGFLAEVLFHDSKLTIYIKAFSFTIILALLSNIFLALIRARQQILKYTFIINVVHNLSRLVGIIIFIILGFRSQAIIGSYIFGAIIMVLVAYISVRSLLKKIYSQESLEKNSSASIIQSLFSYSWPMMLAGLIASLVYWIDSLVIGHFLDASSVGVYGAAFTIVSLLGIAPELFMQLFLPLIIKEYSKNNNSLIEEISKQISKWILILNVPLLTAMVIFPETLIALLFGEMYLPASTALRILAIGGIFSSFTSISINLLSMKGKSKNILYTLIIIGALNFFLGVLLVGKYGLNGVAFATSMVWIIFFLMSIFQSHYLVKIRLIRRLSLRILVLALFLGLLLFFAKSNVQLNSVLDSIFALAIYTIFYFISLFLIGSLDRHDKKLLKDALIKVRSKSKI